MSRVHIKHMMLNFLPGLLLLASVNVSYGQGTMGTGVIGNRDHLGISNMTGRQNSIQYGNVPSVVDNENPEDTTTTQKPPKIRKPLESYFFNDSMRVRQNFVWNVDMGKNIIKEVQIDTMLNEFQVEYPYLQNSVGAAYLGNLGAANIPLNYFDRPEMQNFSFASAFNTYLMTPERARFFNVKKPFTHLSYFFAGQTKKLEESFWGTHAQNISPSSGFNIDYRSRGTKGYYSRQKARDKNLSMGFSHTGKKYTIHAGYIYNMADVRENGGIMDDRDIVDTVYELPELVKVNMEDAQNVLKNNIFYVVQSYGVPLSKLDSTDFSIADRSSIFVGHSFQYSRFSKKYSDTKEGTGDYYNNWYINPVSTYDSIFESVLSNKLFVQIQPWDREGVVGVIDAGIGNDLMHYYQFTPSNYLKSNNGTNKSSTYVYGSVEGHLKKYLSWSANAQYHPFGYRSQDLYLGADLSLSAYIKGRPITLRGSITNDLRTPSYWTENYFSNHFVWQNSFSKETETRIDVSLTVPHIGMELGAHQSVVSNKIYYGADMMPAQHSGSVSVSGLYAKKDFHFGGFHLNNRVLLQWSTVQEVIPVPLASVYLSYFFEFNIVKNVLRLQLGIDGRYNTKYYAFGYNPAIAQFYNQREKKLGNYPMLDVFAAAKWKRMRILVKLQHANEDLFGERNYFTVLHYPLNKRMLKFGISWTFYD